MRRRLYKGDHADLAMGLSNLASARLVLGRGGEAEPLLVESLEMRQRLYKGDHLEVATGLSNLALTRLALGKTAEAQQGFDQAVAMLRRLSPDASPMLARTLARAGSARFDDGRGDAAAALPDLEEAVLIAEELLPPEHPHLAQYRASLAKCRAVLAEMDKAGGKEEGA
jgi:tetratricopeptide (TPR) repeat protein